MTDKNLYHVIYAGEFDQPAAPVKHTEREAFDFYNWFRVVEAKDGFHAIIVANEEVGQSPRYNEVYFVTAFIQQPTQKIEVVI